MKRHNTDWISFAHPLGFIRLILLVDWDPIGILGEPKAMDEYDAYAVEVYDVLQSDGSAADLAGYLDRIQKERIGVKGRIDDLPSLAEKIYRAYHTAHDADAE